MEISITVLFYHQWQIYSSFDNKLSSKEELVTDIYTQVKRILEVATDYGFDKNYGRIILHIFLLLMRIHSALPVKR